MEPKLMKLCNVRHFSNGVNAACHGCSGCSNNGKWLLIVGYCPVQLSFEIVDFNLRILVSPTVLRPQVVREKYPVNIIEDVYEYRKYDPQLNVITKAWCWVQGIITFTFLLYMFMYFSEIGFPGVFLMGCFIYLSVFNYTTLMDGHRLAWLTSLIHTLSGICIILFKNDFFKISEVGDSMPYVMVGYFIISFIVTIFILKKESERQAIMTIS